MNRKKKCTKSLRVNNHSGSLRTQWFSAACGLCGLLAFQIQAQDLSFSDPANVIPTLAWAVGQAIRPACSVP